MSSNLRQQLGRYAPITAWLPAYARDLLRTDVISGITVWGVMVPVAMAYAQMAGVPPQAGLYAAFAALLAYAVFGTSRHLKVTASSTMAVMSAAVVGSIAAGDVERYLALTAALALTVGVLLLLAGIARLGFISDFLSKSVVTGFVFGLAITIAIGQLPKLFGVPAVSGNSFQQLAGLIAELDQTNPWTLAIGAGALALIFVIKRLYPRIPAGLVALALGILAVTIFNLDQRGVSIVGAIPTGLPTPGLPHIALTDLPFLITGAVGIVFLAVGESLGSARAFAARYRYEIDPDQELPAFRRAPNWSAVVLSLCLLIAAQVATSVHAQDAGAIQEVTGILRPGEGIYFQVNGLQQGQTLYVHADNTSGNLDPFLAVFAGETDVELLRKQFAESVAALLAAGNGPIVAADLTAEALSLAWNDDLDASHAAGLAFQAPADGDYLLLLRSSLVRPTFGGYRLLVGLDAPEVLTGNATSTGDTVVVVDAERSTHTRGTQEVIGELTTPKVTTFYPLAPVDAGDTLALRVEATSGDLRPIVELHDPTGKPVRIGNSAGEQTEALVEYTFPNTDSGYTLHISAGGAPEQPTSGAFRVLAAINEPIPQSDAIETGGRPILQLPIPVSLGVKLQQLTAVDQKAENYGAQVALRMEWQDPALAYDPDKCHCSEKTYSTESFRDFINAAKGRWPEFTLYNQQDNRWTQNKHVTVYPDGRAVYLERFTTTFQAPDFYFRRFPFDEQQFFIRVDGIYPEEAYVWGDNPQYTEVGTQLGEEEWYVTSSDTEVSTQAISTKRPTSRYSFRFVARRHLSYYIFRFFVPLTLILLVSWITFFLVDFTKRIEAASANLLLFIAWNFAIGGDLPHLNYLTFMDALILSAFIISVTMVLYNVILRRMEIRGHREKADRIDKVMMYAYPLSYLAAIAILYFFFF